MHITASTSETEGEPDDTYSGRVHFAFSIGMHWGMRAKALRF